LELTTAVFELLAVLVVVVVFVGVPQAANSSVAMTTVKVILIFIVFNLPLFVDLNVYADYH